MANLQNSQTRQNSPIRSRKRMLCVAWLGSLLAIWGPGEAGRAAAEGLSYLQIATGPLGESHFPLGGLISSAISNPPGLRTCGHGGGCGVPGLISMAAAGKGAVADLQDLAAGHVDAVLAPADMALWSFQGKPPFEAKPFSDLQVLAQVGQDRLHIVVRQGSSLNRLRDLKGKRVSIGERGSASQTIARMLFAAVGLKEKDIRIETLRAADAADALASGRLDAVVLLDGVPSPALAELAKRSPITVMSLDQTTRDALHRRDAVLTSVSIPEGSYQGTDKPVETVAVPLVLVVSNRMKADLAEAIVRTLRGASARQLVRESGVVSDDDAGWAISAAALGLPMHPGAQRVFAAVSEK